MGTRPGHVFRSDALHALTAADLEILGGLELALLIDLRTNSEIARSGPSPLATNGVRVLHAPVLDVDSSPEEIDRAIRLEHLYVHMLERAQASFTLIFNALADEANLPAVMHCAAGKDRTGVTTALLRVLGVADSEIVADYALTDRNMARMIAQMQATIPDIREMNVPEHLIRAAPETMEVFLATLDSTYGSAEGYLELAGMDKARLDVIRKRLLS